MGLVKRKGTWCFEWWENRKRNLKSLATGNKREADIRAEKFRQMLRARRGGFKDLSDTEGRPLAELVDEYSKELRRRGRSDAHAEKTRRRILVLCKGARSVLELDTEEVHKRLVRLAEVGTERKGFRGTMPAKPFSAKTSNDYRAALHGLFSWLVKQSRWHENPVARVERARAHTTTRERRALAPEELEQLLAAAPFERGVLYRVAATTGLRRNECRSLRWSSIDLEAATVTVSAGSAKNRKAATLPLTENTVAALEQLRAVQKEKLKGEEVPATAPVFSRIPLIRTFYLDLKNAKLQKSAAFEGVDFHSLRVTFATSLARADVSLAQAQKLMRHSTPVLTANVYTKLVLVDAHAAVAKIDPARGCDLGRGRPESKATLPGLTATSPQPEQENGAALETKNGEGLKPLHPAGFEPARWGSKPPSESSSGKGLGEREGVASRGRAIIAAADLEAELLREAAGAVDAGEDSAPYLAAAAAVRAKKKRAERDEGDGKVLKLGG